MFGRFERNTCLMGLFQAVKCYFLCFKMSQVYFVCCSVFFQDSQVRSSSVTESEETITWLPKQHILPSTCLLPTEHVTSHHNGGLLHQIQQSAWPGPWEHSDRYQTRDGWHTTRTLTVSPFSLFYMSAWIPYKMQSQWCMLQVAKDCTSGWDMHLFSCLAHWASIQLEHNLVWLCCYNPWFHL